MCCPYPSSWFGELILAMLVDSRCTEVYVSSGTLVVRLPIFPRKLKSNPDFRALEMARSSERLFDIPKSL